MNLAKDQLLLIDRAFDDDLTDAEIDALAALLKDSAEARAHYYDRTGLETMIRHELRIQAAESPAPLPPETPSPLRFLPWLVAAAAVGLAFFLWRGADDAVSPIAANPAPPERVATQTSVTAAELPDVPQPSVLSEGVVRLELPNVRLAIAGPASYRQLSPALLELNYGTVIAHVSPDGTGFTVRTPSADMVDLGTVFAVRTEDDQASAHVFQGLVRVDPANDRLPVTLEAGQSLTVWRDAEQTLAVGHAELDAFRAMLPYATDLISEVDHAIAHVISRPDPVFGSPAGRWAHDSIGKTPTPITWDVTTLVKSQPGNVVEINFPTNNAEAAIHSLELSQGLRVLSQLDFVQAPRSSRGSSFRMFLYDQPVGSAPVVLRALMSTRNPRAGGGLVWLKRVSPASTLLPNNPDWHGNLAKNRPASADSWERDAPPSLAVDGDSRALSGWWASPLPQSMDVDLGAVHRIDRIRAVLYWRDTRRYRYHIQTSTDMERWHTVVDMSANRLLATPEGDAHQFDPIDGRYVRFHFLDNSANFAGHLSELEVFADE